MRLGVLTGGGDCPGLNAVIRAIVRTGAGRDVTFVGFRDGWRGVLEDDDQHAGPRDGPRDPPSRRHDPRAVPA